MGLQGLSPLQLFCHLHLKVGIIKSRGFSSAAFLFKEPGVRPLGEGVLLRGEGAEQRLREEGGAVGQRTGEDQGRGAIL